MAKKDAIERRRVKMRDTLKTDTPLALLEYSDKEDDNAVLHTSDSFVVHSLMRPINSLVIQLVRFDTTENGRQMAKKISPVKFDSEVTVTLYDTTSDSKQREQQRLKKTCKSRVYYATQEVIDPSKEDTTTAM
jgi:hypothetical protein